MKKHTWFLGIGLFSLLFYSCNNKNKQYIKYEINKKNNKNYIIKYLYNFYGNIIEKQYFNKDTVPDGPKIRYYPNGIISSWIWFRANHKNPACGIFYDRKGVFDTMKGSPFLDGGWTESNGETYVKLINPPQLGYIIEFEDFYENKLVEKRFYGAVVTDSTNYIMLKKYNYNKNHKYYIVFCVADTVKRVILHQYPKEIIESK